MALLYIWIATIAVAIYFHLRRVYSTFERAGIKYLPPVPLLGNMAGVMFRREHLHHHLKKLYYDNPTERFVGRFEFIRPSILVRDIELIKKIVVKDFEHFVDHHSLIDWNVDPLFGRNIFNLKGQQWKEMRSALSPAFTSSKMKLMMPFMVEMGKEMMTYLKEEINNKGGHIDVDILDLCNRYANDVIASCAFGTIINSHRERDNYFYLLGKDTAKIGYKELMKIFVYGSFPFLTKIFNIGILSEKSTKFYRTLILSTMKTREENKIFRNDMIHLLMEAKKGKLTHDTVGKDADFGFATVQESAIGKKSVQIEWPDDDLVAQGVVFFIAGFDTVASSMTWILHELALNPDIQERLYQEIKENELKNDGKFDFKSIQEMKYLDMVLSESLRKWFSGVWLERICTKDYNCGKPNDKAEKDFILRKGQGLNIPVSAIHHDPEYFPDPMKFDPERFSDENKHKINPYTYMPFGLGPRNCIGSRFAISEMKVMTYTLLQQLVVSPCEKTNLTGDLDAGTGMTIRLKGGHWLKLQLRN